jgi:murein DD-endopeptidase MepM/ murein hydrolase activator NlpD
VTPGQFVQSGEVVGTVGNTGNARTTPPHLHFGVYLRRRGMRGGATDPTNFLH